MIAELELSLLSYNFTIQAHSNKLRELENEANVTQHFVQEQSNELAELKLSMLSYNFTLQTHNDILRELENDFYVTHQIIQDHSDALEDVKGKIH